MYLGLQYVLLAALATTARAFMVKLVDGSFAPWSLEGRAPSGGLPLTLTNHNDMSYVTTVLMGTPFQEVDMSPSLSQNFISVATVPAGVSSSTYYNPTTSSSYKPGNDVGSVPGLTGQTITGRFANEICMLKATNAVTFTYPAAVLLTNSTTADDLYPVGARGVLGYGVNTPTTAPINASLIPTFLPPNFTKAVCGIELNHMDDPVPNGIFTMGAVDPTAYTGDFTNVQVPADSPVSWAVPFDSLTYSSGGSNQTVQGLVASVDIYHSVIQVPTDMATQIYASVPSSQATSNNVWTLPCTSKFSITLTFSGKPFTINERDTIVKLSDGTCQGAVTGGAQQMAKVGAPFLRNVYTQFGVDKTGATPSVFVGFAAKNLRTATTVSTTTVLAPTTVTAGAPGSTKASSTSDASRIAVQNAGLMSLVAVALIFALIL